MAVLPRRVRRNRAGDGGGWSVDFPRADINMSIRLSELTKTTVSFAAPEEPNHVVVRLTDRRCSSARSS